MAKRGPRQKSLPTMEDTAIRSLENAAFSYVETRDARMALSSEEHAKKTKILAEMKRAGKTHYSRNGLTVDVVVESETVKIRSKKPKDEATEA